MKREYTVSSLFCGCGGLDMGFAEDGYRIIWANDKDKDSCATYKIWSGVSPICESIARIDPTSIGHTDVFLGGFPCQGFSLAGPRKIDDSRNVLYRYYVEAVKAVQPLVFVGENVKGLLTMGGGSVIRSIVKDFSDCGYDVSYQLVNMADYGVPQERERVIILGFRKDLNIRNYVLPKFVGSTPSLAGALQGMKDPEENEVCRAPFSSRYMSRNRKRAWYQYSFTIPAMAKQVPLFPGSSDMVRKGKDLWEFGKGITRRLSYRECAVIQTFPRDMEFCGNLESKYRQIGNAVPPKFARYLAGCLREALNGCSQ